MESKGDYAEGRFVPAKRGNRGASGAITEGSIDRELRTAMWN